MKWMLDLQIAPAPDKISYKNKILLIGSCFSLEIGSKLKELKFTVLQNPNGILYDPVSIGQSLVSYIHNRQYQSTDLFQLNELWHSWQYHSEFSGVSKNEVLNGINASQGKAHD